MVGVKVRGCSYKVDNRSPSQALLSIAGAQRLLLLGEILFRESKK